MSQSEEDSQREIDRTYKALIRPSFDELLRLVSELTGDDADYLEWLWSKNNFTGVGEPNLLHGAFYKSHNWTWEEMVNEAKRRRNV